MSSLGAHLRQLRETRGVSLEEIARVTRVNAACLRALEADDFTSLPVPVFTRGFIRAYCQALGEAPEQSLALYEARGDGPAAGASPAPTAAAPRAAAVPPTSPHGSRPASESVARNRGPVLVSFVLLVVLGVALFALTLALESGRVASNDRRGGRGTPASGRAAEGAASAVAPASPSTTAAPRPAGYRLVARTVQTTWMRVRTEDGKTTEETIPAGQVREWFSTGPFTLTVGNAGGVNLELNGRALPPLGAAGVVIPRLVVPTEIQ